jgi:FKBP-type peptidyl-prolyl cis-trans isomerase
MKVFMVTAAGLGLLAVSALAQEKDAPKAGAELKDLSAKVSYIIGQNIGKQLKGQAGEIDADTVLRGIKDALAGKSLMTDQEIADAQTEFRKVQIAKQAEVGDKVKKEGEVFLAENKKKEGVKTTASGLQYQVLREGTGKSPKATDTVTVNYEGKLIDGRVFDSSYKRGEPTTFPLNRVIPGWTEGLQLMKVGSKYRLFIPSELAYGARPQPGGVIRPNDALIFEVELLDVK